MKLISDILTQGWTETDIQLKYGYFWNTIKKAKEEMARSGVVTSIVAENSPDQEQALRSNSTHY